jgi:pantetheine-phosphate adenylyltransferase
MVAMNQRLSSEIETVFLMADPRHQAIASRLVKEIAILGGDITAFTTPAVAKAVIKRCKENP